MTSPTKHPALRQQAPWVVGCRIVGILAMIGGNIIAARLLGPAEFGRYLFLSSVAVCGSLIGAAGLSDAILRFSSESLALGRRRLAAAYVLRTARLCIASTLLAAVITAGGLTAFQLVTGRLTHSVFLVVLTVLGVSALTWQQWASETLRGWNNVKVASLFAGGTAGGPMSTLIFLAALAGLLVARVHLTATGAIGLLAASVALTVPFAVWCVWRTTRRELVDAAEPAAPLTHSEDHQLRAMARTILALDLLAFVVEQLDFWIGEALLPPDQLGMYGAAKRSMLIVAMPVQMAMLTIIAAIPRLHAQGRRRELQDLMRGSASIAAVPSLAALALLVLFPDQIMHFLFGGSYAGAAPLIRILAFGQLALILIGNPSCLLGLTGGHRSVLSVNISAAVLIIVGGPLAAAAFGASGLAGLMAGTLAMQCAGKWWFARRQSGIWTHVGTPIPLLINEGVLRPRARSHVMETTRQLTKANTLGCAPIPVNSLSASQAETQHVSPS